MAVHIVADSTCDLSAEQVARFGITILPLYVALGSESHLDGVDITAQDIFRHVDGGGALPKTAAVSIQDYSQCFSALLEKEPHDEVLCITIGSKFSSCFQNAVVSAGELMRVVVVDSQNLSTGYGLVVLSAAEMAEKGLAASEIAERLRAKVIPRVDASFILDRLDYLHKGGRCSSIAALGANLLKLKPCITVQNGEMRVTKKYRGNYERCVEQYVQDRLSSPETIDAHRAFITHTAATDSAIQTAKQKAGECVQFEELCETLAGCTVSSHCGPNTLGILFIHK